VLGIGNLESGARPGYWEELTSWKAEELRRNLGVAKNSRKPFPMAFSNSQILNSPF